jgi:hypothetical protein
VSVDALGSCATLLIDRLGCLRIHARRPGDHFGRVIGSWVAASRPLVSVRGGRCARRPLQLIAHRSPDPRLTPPRLWPRRRFHHWRQVLEQGFLVHHSLPAQLACCQCGTLTCYSGRGQFIPSLSG